MFQFKAKATIQISELLPGKKPPIYIRSITTTNSTQQYMPLLHFAYLNLFTLSIGRFGFFLFCFLLSEFGREKYNTCCFSACCCVMLSEDLYTSRNSAINILPSGLYFEFLPIPIKCLLQLLLLFSALAANFLTRQPLTNNLGTDLLHP